MPGMYIKPSWKAAVCLPTYSGGNPQRLAVYTYGGSGCWLYGLKYAITRVLPGSRDKGVRTDGKVLVSAQAHYCRENATDWTGLGMDNVVVIPTDPNNNQMDLNALEAKLKEFTSAGIPVIEVVCTMGTTDASVFDPIADVRTLMDKYPNPRPTAKPCSTPAPCADGHG